MFPIHRAALRLFSTPSISFATRSRTVTSLSSSPFRVQRQTQSLLFPKRWASDEVKKDGDLPISQLQPTPQEEVENAIIEDNTACTIDSSTETPSQPIQPPTDAAPAVTESANATEATEDAVSEEESATDRSQEAVSSAAAASSNVGASSRQSFANTGRSDGRNSPKQTIYIGNLFFDVTEDDLTREVARFGQVKTVKLIRDARGLSKGFGYVTFSTTEEATGAIDGLNQQLFEGRRLNVAYASQDSATISRTMRPRERAMNPPSKTLFIGNMSWQMTDRDLNNLFKGIKNIIDVRVAIDRRTGQPRGFAHADFTDVQSATDAMRALEGKETYGRTIKLDYSYGANTAPRNQAKDEGSL